MKKWFYAFMLSLMVIFGMMGCTPTGSDIENNGEESEPAPVHITMFLQMGCAVIQMRTILALHMMFWIDISELERLMTSVQRKESILCMKRTYSNSS